MTQSLCSAYITAARETCTVPLIRKIIRYCSTLALLHDITCKVTCDGVAVTITRDARLKLG